jgi:hypothetical protein
VNCATQPGSHELPPSRLRERGGSSLAGGRYPGSSDLPHGGVPGPKLAPLAHRPRRLSTPLHKDLYLYNNAISLGYLDFWQLYCRIFNITELRKSELFNEMDKWAKLADWRRAGHTKH